ncbi:MAG: rhomboid family intramembrane serine protease [Armatimonadetes bacterium]|nr:rhomboid family intramembrane serine protease [Armatimonadota bacterium]
MLIPLPYATTDRRELRSSPVVTLFLVLFHCGVFALSAWSGLGYVVDTYGLRGARPSGMGLTEYAATAFTSLALHANSIHLAVNMAYLWVFGCLVEDVLGRAEYLLFYIGSGIAGMLVRLVVVRHLLPSAVDEPAVGASAAVAGILGVFAIRFYRARIRALLVPWALPAQWGIGVWVGLQAAFAVASLFSRAGTGCWSHVGGFLFGVASGLLMRLGREADEEYLWEDVRRRRRRAYRHLEELLRRNPHDPQVHLALARTFLQAKEVDAAAVHARKAVELAALSGDASGAVASYTALRPLGLLGELSLEAEFRVACTLEGQHRLREAAQAYKNVYQHYPEAPEAETAIIRRAQVLQRDPATAAEATTLYREYLERYPEGQWRALATPHTAG